MSVIYSLLSRLPLASSLVGADSDSDGTSCISSMDEVLEETTLITVDSPVTIAQDESTMMASRVKKARDTDYRTLQGESQTCDMPRANSSSQTVIVHFTQTRCPLSRFGGVATVSILPRHRGNSRLDSKCVQQPSLAVTLFPSHIFAHRRDPHSNHGHTLSNTVTPWA